MRKIEAFTNPEVKVGDKIQIRVDLLGGGFFWGTIQTVKWISREGMVYYRAKHGKVDKVAYRFRLAPAPPEKSK